MADTLRAKYPIKNIEDLKAVIRSVGRAPDLDAAREHIIARATAVKGDELIPDGWATLAERGAWTVEQRETANDVFAALDSAVCDACGGDSWCAWVQDWYGDGSDEYPFTVVYYSSGDLYSAPFSWDADDKIVLGESVKVRPVTQYVERSERPLVEWRRRKVGDIKGLERRTFPASEMELRETGDGVLHLSGYASVTETPYEVGFYTETIKRGAFKRTLGEGPDVQLLVNHEGLPLARTKSGTLTLTEDERGLKVDADLDPEDPDVQSLSRKMKRGDIDQMSFAFMVTSPADQQWNEDYTSRTISAVSIHRGDVSVVNQGANPAAAASIRSQDAVRALQRVGAEGFVAALTEWRDHTLLPLEERAGKALSAATMETLSQVLNLVAAADDAVDEAQPLLAELMGVPNPDDDEPAEEPDEAPAEPRALPDYTTNARERVMALRARGAR